MTVIQQFLAWVALASMAVAAPSPQSQDSPDPDPFHDSNDCSSNIPGSGPSPDNDTPAEFLELLFFGQTSTSVDIPYGYTQSFVNQNATVWNYQTFLDFNELTNYDPAVCASQCTAYAGCNAFTIYFERDPLQASTTRINCNLYSGGITVNDANFPGKSEEDFQIVIAGSNAYNKNVNLTVPDLPGYKTDIYTSGGAIDAPLDCFGNNTYLGVAKWYDGEFDAQRCVDVCTNNGQCHFVNTYFQALNAVPYTQHCALYTVHWPSWYATNVGQVRGSNDVSISDTSSFGFTDSDGTNYEACEPIEDMPNKTQVL